MHIQDGNKFSPIGLPVSDGSLFATGSAITAPHITITNHRHARCLGDAIILKSGQVLLNAIVAHTVLMMVIYTGLCTECSQYYLYKSHGIYQNCSGLHFQYTTWYPVHRAISEAL